MIFENHGTGLYRQWSQSFQTIQNQVFLLKIWSHHVSPIHQTHQGTFSPTVKRRPIAIKAAPDHWALEPTAWISCTALASGVKRAARSTCDRCPLVCDVLYMLCALYAWSWRGWRVKFAIRHERKFCAPHPNSLVKKVKTITASVFFFLALNHLQFVISNLNHLKSSIAHGLILGDITEHQARRPLQH